MTQQADEQQPPELQDTSERSALPLPLPGSEQPAPVEAAPAQAAPEPPTASEFATPEPDPPAAEPQTTAAEPAPAPEPALVTSEPAAPEVPPFEPASTVAGIGAPAAKPKHPEVAVGAAFVGGLALALFLKRLGT